MNSIRQIQDLNKRELENNIGPNASWHTDYRDTAYVYIGGLPFDLSEGDIITIFSQYGEPTYINLIRDKETGKSKGFAFLKYEDQRSTDLAVDNLGGAVVVGRTLKVDHTRYKKKDDDEGMDLTAPQENGSDDGNGEGRRKRRWTSESESEERPMLREEVALARIIQDHDEDDPMKAFLVEEKKEEVAMALARYKGGKSSSRRKTGRKHHHRSRQEREDEENGRSRRRRDRKENEKRRSLSRDDDRERERRTRRAEGDRSEGHRQRRRSPRGESRERLRGDQERGSGQEGRRNS